MRDLAIISQTLRASHCHAYMNEGEPGQTILTSDPTAFAGYEFDVPTRVIAVSPPPELLPRAGLAGRRVFRSILSRARSGSRFGAWLEGSVKAVVRRLRPARGSLPARRRRPIDQIDGQTIRSSAMYATLEEQHRSGPIDRIIVFDVFDLPVAMAFADDHEIEVLVR